MLRTGAFVPVSLLDTLDEIKTWVKKLPENPLGHGGADDALKMWPAGALVRAAKIRYKLDDWAIVDGQYETLRIHSWLERLTGDPQYALVLDIQPLLIYGGPIIYLQSNDNWDRDPYRGDTLLLPANYAAKCDADAQTILDLG